MHELFVRVWDIEAKRMGVPSAILLQSGQPFALYVDWRRPASANRRILSPAGNETPAQQGEPLAVLTQPNDRRLLRRRDVVARLERLAEIVLHDSKILLKVFI